MSQRRNITISEVHFTSAQPRDVEQGLIGWISCTLDDRLRIDGIALRRTRDGRLTLSYPARRDALGLRRHFVRPLDDDTRREIEALIFKAIGIAEGAA